MERTTKGQPKIALSVIYKGTEDKQQIYRMLSSIAGEVDAIYATATWTRKGDATKVIKSFGGKVSFFKWVKNFSKARNYAIKQIPAKYEYVFWLDTDDVFVNKSGHTLRELAKHGLDAYYMTYNYQIDEKTGEVLIQHPRERLIKNHIFEWKGALHETLLPLRPVKNTMIKDMYINHFPDSKEIQGNVKRNVEILEETYKAEGDKHDPRTEYYLGRALFDATEFKRAEALFKNYLKKSGWDEERAMALNYLAESYRLTGKYDKAIDTLLKAIKERPEFPTWFINLGVIYAKIQDWNRAMFYTKLGLKMDYPKTAMVSTPRDDKIRALETIYFACLEQKKLKEAFASADKLLEFFPGDEFLTKRRDAVYNLMRWTEMSKNAHEIVLELKNNKEDDKIDSFLNALPGTISENAFLEKLKMEYAKPKKWPQKSIVYFCGKAWEEWDALSMEEGIGGSETAVIQLSKEWTKAGYKVTVFGSPKEEGIYDGVEYLNYWRFNPNDTFDTLIIWRAPSMLENKFKARKVFVDMHDVFHASDFTQDRLKQVDKIFVKSKFHQSMLPKAAKKKSIVVPNGVDLTLIDWKEEKNPYRLIYTSSYDRGLEYMLRYGWPIIKKAVPEAELHIYYGWNLFDTIHKNNPERKMWKAEMLKLMKQKGVHEHGRIPQKKLMIERKKSAIHYYGCTFEEIDCISVRESAAVGCIPFTTNYAALKEKTYCMRRPGDIFSPETHKRLALDIVSYLKGNMHSELFAKIPARARLESWPEISKAWLKEIK